MNLTSRFLERWLKLPTPTTRDLVIERDLVVPMRDGIELLADRWAPRLGGAGLPTALIRTPYGRRGVFGAAMARPLAERGYQVLLQSTRGGFGSGGDFVPKRQERDDGLVTLEWLVNQPWLGESIVLAGVSYMGYVQWAVADSLPPQVKAIIPQVTDSALDLEQLRTDGFTLEAPFNWAVLVAVQERRWATLAQLIQIRRNRRALHTLPLNAADVAALGYHSSYFQDVLVHDADDPYWADTDHRHRVGNVTVPVSAIGGWYDIFLPGQLRDFRALQAAVRPARLTIGPWTHAQFTNVGVEQALEFGLANARGEQPPPRAPVRLYVMGQDAWRDFDSWPPEGYEPQRFHLHPDGALATQPPSGSEPDRYRYDPADPTPAVGGVRVSGGGRVNNDTLEARADVLTYTTEVLDSDVEVIGEVSAQIWFQSSLPSADVFVRLCDVDQRGRSHNVCDGLTSLSGADGVSRCTVRLWPTAYRFNRGHRIRLQVSSGAFPRFARNHGTGEPRATAVTLQAGVQAVYHDATHPSAVILPTKNR